MVAPFRRPYPTYRVNAYQVAADNPMSEMKTTPLIDVLLVLLIMSSCQSRWRSISSTWTCPSPRRLTR